MLLLNFSKKQNTKQEETSLLTLLGAAEEQTGLFNASEPKPTADFFFVPSSVFVKPGTACCAIQGLLYADEHLFQSLVQVSL